MKTADAFRSLHAPGEVLRLPNAWDVPSALLLAQAGAAAVATSSASLSWALGYADGGCLPSSLLVSTAQRMAAMLPVPLSVDIEDGLSASQADVAALAAQLASAGVAGINLEDGAQPPERLRDKIAAIRAHPRCAGLFINARTDVYLRGLASGDAAVEEVVTRAASYAAAGADALFVPGVQAPADMRGISARTPLLLNVMTVGGLPSLATLAECGVRRVSSGPRTFLAAYGQLVAAATAFLHGELEAPFASPLDYAGLNALMSSPGEALASA